MAGSELAESSWAWDGSRWEVTRTWPGLPVPDPNAPDSTAGNIENYFHVAADPQVHGLIAYDGLGNYWVWSSPLVQ